MGNITGEPTGSAGPAVNMGRAEQIQQPAVYVCQVPGCDRSFPTVRGRGVHQQRGHKDWYDAQQNVEQVKERWSAEEGALLARQEARLVVEGKKFLNQELMPFFPGRTLEAVKGQRRKQGHKDAVLAMVDEIRREAEEVEEPGWVEAANDDARGKIADYLSNLPLLRTRAFEPRLLDEMCKSAGTWSRDRMLAEVTGYLLKILPVVEPRRNRQDVPENVVISKRRQRRKDYACCQSLWRRNRGECLRKILKDKKEARPPPKRVMVPFWERVMTREVAATPGVDHCRQVQEGLWDPVRFDELKKAYPDRGTAPGPDGLTSRMLRSVPGEVLVRVLNIFMLCESLPAHLLESRTTLIPKKDGANEPGEYRPITVSSVLTRLFHKILANRILGTIELDPRQKAFLPVDGCAENVFLLDLLLRQYRKSFKPLFIASLDIAKAFDSVSHQALQDTLLVMGVPEQMIRYIMYTYERSFTRLACDGWQSHRIHPTCGVKQGDPLSPIIFNMIIDRLFQLLPKEVGARVGKELVNARAFADDLFLAAVTGMGLQMMIDVVEKYLGSCGLLVNADKCFTVALRNVPKQKKSVVDPLVKFRCGGRMLPALSRTEQWRYLGVMFSPEGRVAGQPVQALKLAVEQLTKAPLKPQQRMYGLRVVVLPGLYHQLTLGETSVSVLRKVDKVSRAAVRQWMCLPHDTPNAYFHAEIKDGGLSVPSVRWLMPLRRLERLRNLELHEEREQSLATVFLAREIERSRGRLRDRDVGLETAKLVSERWAKLLHTSTDGMALKRSRDVPAQHRWVGDGTRLVSGRDYINMTRLRINALPVKSRTSRGRRRDRMCRAGCLEVETLNHVLQRCHRTHAARVDRHNACASYVARAMAKQYQVVEEPHFQTEVGLRKPDLLGVMGVTAVVVDAQVISEQADLERAHKAKVDYYKGLENAIKQRYQVENVFFTSLTMTLRGVWSKDSAKDLCNLGILRTSELKILSTRALIGGLHCFRMFNRATGIRDRRGIG